MLSVMVTVAVLWVLQCLVVPKYQTGITEGSMIREYYDSDMPHEVLFIGDCEVYENFSTVEMYLISGAALSSSHGSRTIFSRIRFVMRRLR